jgi:NADPH-dependent glutamate synthase beta subunit-like oxidoreductase
MAAYIFHSCYRNTYSLRTETLARLSGPSHYSVRRLCLATHGRVSSDNIAVIGGGITGLTTAYFAAHKFPTASITLYEASSRVGGAIESTRVTARIPGGDHDISFLCERGPRTLRANADRASVTYELVSRAESISLFHVVPVVLQKA